jgi:sporulation protein YlmC with PRC-barrel domain
MAGKVLHAQLHLQDRQLIDHRTGRLLGKVDDVELDLNADPPVVTALISGGQRIPAHLLVEVDTAVKISNQGPDLDRWDDWVERKIITKIPGAGDAAT